MPRNYHTERDAIIRRWYGGYAKPRGRRPQGPVTPWDCLGIPIPVNLPFTPLGHCMVWKHALNRYRYGVLTTGGKQELVHGMVFIQTRGNIPETCRSTTSATGPTASNRPISTRGLPRTTRTTPGFS